MIRTGARALLVAMCAAQVATAQQTPVSVHGIAYDSLRNTPLDGAIVSVTGTGRTTVSDRRGRFQLDSIPPGTHTFVMNHDALDSLGLPAVSSRMAVTDGRDDIHLAITAFATFWKAGCARPAPRDSILVYGSVRRAGDLAPAAGARVELAWIDLASTGQRDVTQRVQTLTVTTDANGSYGFCGVPGGAGLRIWAATDRAASWISRRVTTACGGVHSPLARSSHSTRHRSARSWARSCEAQRRSPARGL